ncbi:MAG: tRNA (adenosine(37)-N6)-threonylcarbamoyltransferase complex dimerization subunit type 1 TsaB [Candidatus Omnitrophica bacterium]|nr:tRNA (adenosine(37)-N6)-threonylcarbamoyltransferase complex dimerization subunit type 1 TsaB [Candidatus Omnitrophota bacterium]
MRTVPKGDHILAVDTSSKVLSIAIRKGVENIFEGNLEGTPRHSEQLMGLIREGLKRLKLPKEELDQLIWGIGPGSFTGLRIGLSVLKGLHLGLRKKAFGGSSLDLIALGTGTLQGKLAVCVDARREHLYVALYQFRTGDVQKVLQDSVLSFDAFMKKVDPSTIFTGDALATYGERIRKRLGKKALFLESSFWYPRALFLMKLWEEKRKWLKPFTLRTMLPEYLRVSEAEEKLSRKRK